MSPAVDRRRSPILPVAGVLMMAGCVWGSGWWEYPPEDAIRLADPSGDRLTIRVDKAHRLPADYVPAGLVVVTPDLIRATREVRVKKELLAPLRELGKAAAADGIDLAVLSGYRSFEQQRQTYDWWLKSQGGDVAATDRFSARPGHSEHQLGTVVDFTTSEIRDGIGPQFNRTKAARWLISNAGRFGFRQSYPKGKEARTGYMHEAWHWRYWGVKAGGKPQAGVP